MKLINELDMNDFLEARQCKKLAEARGQRESRTELKEKSG